MSPDPSPPPHRTLGEYIAALVQALRAGDPGGYARLAVLVAPFRGRVALDGEAVVLSWAEAGLVVSADAPGEPVDGTGATDRATVLALLDGRMEVTDALLDGHIEVRGAVDAVHRMLAAIEILLDSSGRVPALQDIARDFRRDGSDGGGGGGRRTAFGPSELRDAERSLLSRLDLLDG
jgi:hypothetical protein